MARSFAVDVVSPEQSLWSGEAAFLVARTPDGEIGILADHEPVMAALATGAVTVDGADGGRTTIAVNGGFLQVLDNTVTLLTDRAEVVEGDAEAARATAAELAAQADDNPVVEL